MKPRTYDTPAAFKRALEDRLKAASSSGVEFARGRQLLVFDRFLARMAVAFGEAVMLKGGLVLELRLERARTTKDVDLRLAEAAIARSFAHLHAGADGGGARPPRGDAAAHPPLGRVRRGRAAGEAIGIARWLKANTVKRSTISLPRQGLMHYAALPKMKLDTLEPLMAKFGEMLRAQRVFREVFGLI